jgi:hypothetical protein
MRYEAALLAGLLLFCLTSCNPGTAVSPPSPSQTVQETAQPSPPPEPTPEPSLVPYDVWVEHIFFHPLMAYPQLSFSGYLSDGFDDWFVTVEEYERILLALYQNDYILVDINSVWSMTEAENGQKRMARNTLMLPEGKKPLIISFDDVNYYDYMREFGVVYKLIVGSDGEIWSWGLDPDGNEVVSQDLDIITILTKFCKEHPDFSHNNAKGCIGLTGYQGILGYRTQTDRDNPAYETIRQTEIEAVKPVVAKLKEDGYTFASHTWGHISLEKCGLSKVRSDTQRWLDEVGSLVGETQVLLYPFGSRADGNDVTKTGECFRYMESVGFTFSPRWASIYSKVKSDIAAVICDRKPRGTTLRWSRNVIFTFMSLADIDLDARPSRPRQKQGSYIISPLLPEKR